MSKTYDLGWKPTSNEPFYDVASAVTTMIVNVIKDQLPQFIPYFPFVTSPVDFSYKVEGDLFVFQLSNRIGLSIPTIGRLSDEAVLSKARALFASNEFPSFEQVHESDDSMFSFEKITYVGKQHDTTFSWQHISEYVLAALNAVILPEVLEQNRKRVLAVIPEPPAYDVQRIMNNIFIIESPSNATQGSCFYLSQVGFVTCEHCISEDALVYKASNTGDKHPIRILKKHKVVDLAIFTCDTLTTSEGLERGDSDKMQIHDHIAVAGFPNHYFGDSGILSPGLIVGFRAVASIKRMLVNTPLIGGISGSPILSKDNKVIGVAVTGADRMEHACETENHGIIPINALQLI